jgi:hypothetical protein
MKAVTAFSVDVDMLRRMKADCLKYRIPLSAYVDYVLEQAPPLDETMAQFIAAKRQGKASGSLEDFGVRKPVYEILAKGWHFHKGETGIITCMSTSCELERVACPDYYEDSEGNIHATRNDQILYRAV